MPAAAKQADTCVPCVAWCGVPRVEGISPYVGIRIGDIGWNYGGPLIGQKMIKQLKANQRRQTRVYLRFIRLKQIRTNIDAF